MAILYIENLPDELLVHIISYLPETSIIRLHETSRKFHQLTRRDSTLWRSFCFPAVLKQSEAPKFPFVLRSKKTERPSLRNGWSVESGHDPLPDLEDSTNVVDWYSEYKQRHAPLKYTALRIPRDSEARNLAVSNISYENVAISPLDDGSVCLMSLDKTRLGRVLGISRPGLLQDDKTSVSATFTASGLSCDGVSVYRDRAFFAQGNSVIEVDLERLSRVSTYSFPFQVTTLSTTTNILDQPLVVGTTLTLHLHDSRSPKSGSHNDNSLPSLHDRLDVGFDLTPPSTPPSLRTSSLSASLVLDKEERYSRDHLLTAPTAFLQPSPLVIHHSPTEQAGGNELYVAGRFPSILVYDRRLWPKIRGNIHSGARLSGLAVMPSVSSSNNSKFTLLACGEYAGRGTLEEYDLPYNLPLSDYMQSTTSLKRLKSAAVQSVYSAASSSALKNRQSASRSKIFSIAKHGQSIAIGDGDGGIRWLENDGVRGIRRWCIEDEANQVEEMHGSRSGCVTSIIPLPDNGDLGESGSDLVVHIGDGIGYLSVNSVVAEETEIDCSIVPELPEQEGYSRIMRAALEQHAVEMHFMQRFGL